MSTAFRYTVYRIRHKSLNNNTNFTQFIKSKVKIHHHLVPNFTKMMQHFVLMKWKQMLQSGFGKIVALFSSKYSIFNIFQYVAYFRVILPLFEVFKWKCLKGDTWWWIWNLNWVDISVQQNETTFNCIFERQTFNSTDMLAYCRMG